MAIRNVAQVMLCNLLFIVETFSVFNPIQNIGNPSNPQILLSAIPNLCSIRAGGNDGC